MKTLDENKKSSDENKKSSPIAIPQGTCSTNRTNTKVPQIVTDDSPLITPEKLDEKERKVFVRFDDFHSLQEKTLDKSHSFFSFPKISPRKEKPNTLTVSSDKKERSLTKRLSRTWSSESRDSQPKKEGSILNNNLKIERKDDNKTSPWTLSFDKIFKEDSAVYMYSSIHSSTEWIHKKTHVLPEDTLTIHQYIEMKTSQINKIQHDKINKVKQLVTLFNNPEEQSLDHKVILKEQIKKAVELSLCATRLDLSLKIKKAQQHEGYYKFNSMDSISPFWIELLCYLPGDVLQDYKNKVDTLVELMENLFPLVNELELFQTERLPALGKNHQLPYFLTLNYVTELCVPFLKEEIIAQFVEEYTNDTNVTKNEFLCIRDVFFNIQTQKAKEGRESIMMLTLVETILKCHFEIPYQCFIEEQNTIELSESSMKIGATI